MAKRGLMLAARLGLVFLLLATASGVVGCRAPEPTSTPQPTSTPKPTPRPTASPTPKPLDLVVLHTNDVLSYTDPCGWRPPKGGLARRASVIKATRQQSANVLLLDAGDTLYGQQPLAQQSNAKALIDAMNLLGYNAMVIGDLDLQLGVEILRQRLADAKFPILSANLILAGENKLLAQPYTIVEAGGHKVGIIGLTWDGLSPDDPSIKDRFLLLKADLVLPQYVAEVSRQADMVILLSNMGFEEDQRLSSAVPGIDLIVGGRSRIPMNEAWRNETTGTLIVQAGAQGEWIGRRTLQIDSAGVVTAHQDELIYLTDDFADDPEMRAFLDNYQVQ